MKQVKIGVGFGLWRLGMPTPETIVHVAEKAEDWGLDSFWLSDHLLTDERFVQYAPHEQWRIPSPTSLVGPYALPLTIPSTRTAGSK